MKNVQFYTKINIRNGFRGAQIKTWDYFNHVNSHPDFCAHIKFSEDSEWDENVYWRQQQIRAKNKLIESPYLYVLKGGRDWILFDKYYFRKKETPIISPIVNYRVLDENHISNKLLLKKAIRVCPSPDLTHKLENCKKTNGPVICIPNAVRNDTKIIEYQDKKNDILILGLKNPQLGLKIYTDLQVKYKYLSISLLNSFINQREFLKLLNQAKVVIHLPKFTEAHYMPGLESMSLGCVTIMPNCQGNKFYLISNYSGFICNYNYESIYSEISKVLYLPIEEKLLISKRAIKESGKYSLNTEKEKWHELLENIKTIW